MHLLGCLFLLLFSLVAMFLLPVLRLGQFLFGWPRSAWRFTREGDASQQDAPQRPAAGSTASEATGKIFEPGEGEYVDFEEVKD